MMALPFVSSKECLDDTLGFDDIAVLAISQGHLLFPGIDLIEPFLTLGFIQLKLLFLQQAVDILQGDFGVTHDRQVHNDVLIDGRRVHVDVNDLGIGRKGFDLARHAVVKTHTHGDQKIAMADGHVGVIGAVHAQHAEP